MMPLQKRHLVAQSANGDLGPVGRGGFTLEEMVGGYAQTVEDALNDTSGIAAPASQ